MAYPGIERIATPGDERMMSNQRDYIPQHDRGFSWGRRLSRTPPIPNPTPLSIGVSSVATYEPRRDRDNWAAPTNIFVKILANALKMSLRCRECRQSGPPSQFVLCSGCGAPFRPVHRGCLRRRDHSPEDGQCEEVDLKGYLFARYLLCPPAPEQMLRLSAKDIRCAWIGLPDLQAGDVPQIHVYPRLQHLLSGPHDFPALQYPSLVSFIGDTGSGKSTLIRAMIRMCRLDEQEQNSVPLPGLPNLESMFLSTSSDIHVYSDPASVSDESPVFFVDSEGLSGSDVRISPSQDVIRSLSQPDTLFEEERGHDQVPAWVHRDYADQQQQMLGEAQAYLNSPPRDRRFNLTWGGFSNSNPQRNSREQIPHVNQETRKHVVENLFPRLLYAYSDVICFVADNARKSNEFLKRLITWAQEGHDRILNQRILPALIIVLNKDIVSDYYDGAGRDPAAGLLGSYERTEHFRHLQAVWRERGQIVDTAKELLLCYYSSLNVVVIPALAQRSPPSTATSVYRCIGDLYETIQEESRLMQDMKKRRNVKLNVSMLDSHLCRALEVLGMDHLAALDLHLVTSEDSAHPKTFSDHVATTLYRLINVHIREREAGDETRELANEQPLVKAFTPYLAACIVAQLPENVDQETLSNDQNDLVSRAKAGLQQFRMTEWRCEARDSRGRRCRNHAKSHQKGHQFFEGTRPRGDGTLHRSKGSIASWNPTNFAQELWAEMAQLNTREQALDRLVQLAEQLDLLKVKSQLTCLTCLSRCPTNMLPCEGGDHGICETCLRRIGRRSEERCTLEVQRCPLGCTLRTDTWSIRVKPERAGPRVLALDGGGVRGVVELLLLHEIEIEVGYGIRIHELFDLVIGTSTGGIIALRVFHSGQRLVQSLSEFQTLAREAFPPRSGLNNAFSFLYGSKYKDDGIEGALKKTFSSSTYLFGASTSNVMDRVKVGVVTSRYGNNEATLLASYSRSNNNDKDDYLFREDQQHRDFKVWEAARATSAAPTYFQPFVHRGQNAYVDGALFYNNPVQLAYNEARKIWPSAVLPDIVVSLGAGAPNHRPSGARQAFSRLMPKGIRQRIELNRDMVRNAMSCSQAWDKFKETLPRRQQVKYHRLNVALEKKIDLDDVKHMESLMDECKRYLDPGSEMPYPVRPYRNANAHVKAVARRLTASLFYYVGDLGRQMAGGQVRGEIYCRLEPGSDSARDLLFDRPEFQLRQTRRRTDPVFSPVKYRLFNPDNLSARVAFKVEDGLFDERAIEVTIPKWNGRWVQISGSICG
ncbi:hypothetical protein ACJZ2D_003370 [Fusarium nematophilum]